MEEAGASWRRGGGAINQPDNRAPLIAERPSESNCEGGAEGRGEGVKPGRATQHPAENARFWDRAGAVCRDRFGGGEELPFP